MPPDPTRSSPAVGSVGDRTTLSHASVGDVPTVSVDAVRALQELATDTPDPAATRPAGGFDPPPGFVVEKELGEGGMGMVYLARQVGLNRPCALKLVKSAADPKALIRFLAEAEAVAAIRHPNVVEVFQYGDHRGRPYLALEYCPGGDLTGVVSREAKASTPKNAAWFRRVAELLAGIAAGVNAAHVLGIVHRDLKPHNVFLAADGTPKVADFGLAKRGVGSDLTQTDAVMGTPAYMAPEQAGGGTKFVGPEADVWALGVMLYELCCGERPIQLDSSVPLRDALARIVNAAVPPLRTRCPAVPKDLALIAHKCLSADPRERYPTAGGLAADLRNWLDGKPISARPAGAVEQAVKWARRNKKLAGMGLAVLLTMATATGVSLGFGLEANEQRGLALKEKKNAMDATEQAEQEVSRTLRTLAKAVLAPISVGNRDDPLSVYERNALWELAATRNGRVPLMALEEATGSPLAAAQLECRAEFLIHAAVGLDVKRRQQADDLILTCLRDPNCSLEWKRSVALSAVRGEQFRDASTHADVLLNTVGTGERERDVIDELVLVAGKLPLEQGAEVLLAALVKVKEGKNRRTFSDAWVERGVLAEGLAAVAGRLPAEKAADVLLAALEGAVYSQERRALALGLAAAAGKLPADKGAEVCRKGAELLLAALRKTTNKGVREELADALVAVAGVMPQGQRAEVCGQGVDVLLAALKKTTDESQLRALAEALAVVSGVLPQGLRAEVCGQGVDVLLAALKKTTDSYDRRDLVLGLAAVARRLTAEKGVEVLLAALVNATDKYELRALALALAVAAGDLPQGQAAEVCGKGAELLLAALRKAKGVDEQRPLAGDVHERLVLAEGLAAVADRMPAEKAAEALLAELEKGTHGDEARVLAEGLAAVAGRMPAGKATAVCRQGTDLVLAALRKATDGNAQRLVPADKLFERQAFGGCEAKALALGLVAVAGKMPEGQAAEAYSQGTDVLLTAMGRATGGDEWGVRAEISDERLVLAEGLAVVAGKLPTEHAVEILLAACGLAQRSAWAPLARGLATMAGGASHDHTQPEPFASVTGVVILTSSLRSKPVPLPPQQLVELLKHPFCVKEARRAVLDALEFTYDRTFADLWEFVAFAEKEHPELDLLTPPERPESGDRPPAGGPGW